MMATTLLPNLPPELRTEIYAYLSSPAHNPSTTIGLPLPLKTYENRHTAIQVLPYHHGDPSLLSSAFTESTEYNTYLLNNATTLKINVVFYGRVQTFVQAHWNVKVETHLKKLARMHPWLEKVARYEVSILWDAVDVLGKGKRTVGRIGADMLSVLTGMLGDSNVKMKRGRVDVKLRFASDVGGQMAFRGGRFGVGELLGWEGEWRERSMEMAFVQHYRAQAVNMEGAFKLLTLGKHRKDRGLLVMDKDGLGLDAENEGKLLMRWDWVAGRLVGGSEEDPEAVVWSRVRGLFR